MREAGRIGADGRPPGPVLYSSPFVPGFLWNEAENTCGGLPQAVVKTTRVTPEKSSAEQPST